jgi:hypothetical protein
MPREAPRAITCRERWPARDEREPTPPTTQDLSRSHRLVTLAPRRRHSSYPHCVQRPVATSVQDIYTYMRRPADPVTCRRTECRPTKAARLPAPLPAVADGHLSGSFAAHQGRSLRGWRQGPADDDAACLPHTRSASRREHGAGARELASLGRHADTIESCSARMPRSELRDDNRSANPDLSARAPRKCMAARPDQHPGREHGPPAVTVSPVVRL